MERRIEVIARLFPTVDGIGALRPGDLATLLRSASSEIQLGALDHDGQGLRACVWITALDEPIAGPFRGEVVLWAEDGQAVLGVRGAYELRLPGARFGDGVLVHRLVRRRVTLLVEDVATVIRAARRP